MDGGRDLDLGVRLLAQHRRPGGERPHLLRNQERHPIGIRDNRYLYTKGPVGVKPFPAGAFGGAEDVGEDPGAGGV